MIQGGCFLGRDPVGMTPWGFFFGYQVCWAYIHPDGVVPTSREIVKAIKETFTTIDRRWNAADRIMRGLVPDLVHH